MNGKVVRMHTHPRRRRRREKKAEAHSDKINEEKKRERESDSQLDIYNISSGERSHLVRQHFRMTKIVFIMDFFDASANECEWLGLGAKAETFWVVEN